jgi:hypothetical protein
MHFFVPPHAVLGPHVPAATHVSMSVMSVHLVVPGVHVAHDPSKHTGRAPVHAAPFVQVPVALHVCGVLPLHCICPGAHTPVHDPLTHVELLHGVPVVQLPLTHVCGELPMHCV